jgi:type IV secretory pathway VirB6-like protein
MQSGTKRYRSIFQQSVKRGGGRKGKKNNSQPKNTKKQTPFLKYFFTTFRKQNKWMFALILISIIGAILVLATAAILYLIGIIVAIIVAIISPLIRREKIKGRLKKEYRK